MEPCREDYLEAVIRRLLEQYDEADRIASAARKNNLLVVVSGGMGGAQEAIRQLSILSAEGYSMTVVMTSAARTIFGEQWLEINGISVTVAGENESPIELLKKADAVVAPILTINSAAKVSCGIADNQATTILVQALLQEKPVFAAYDACNPNQSMYHGSGKKNILYHRRLSGNIEKLRQYGVQMTAIGELSYVVDEYFSAGGASVEVKPPFAPATAVTEEALPVFKGKVLSFSDVSRHKGDTIKVRSKTIITAAARDKAVERGIRIIELAE